MPRAIPALPLLDEPVRPGEAIARVLEQAGIDAVFGMPGGWTMPIFDALADHRDTIRTVLVREEARAGVMAEVYGRLTGRPGVAMGQGPFLVHASIGAIEAHLSSTPMLLLSELGDSFPFSLHGPYQSGTGDYGSWDARAVFGGFTKAVYVARTPPEGVHAVQLAIKTALAGNPGPVAVLFHSEALRGRVAPDAKPTLYELAPYLGAAAPVPDPDAVSDAADLLAGAQRPVVVAGGGVLSGQATDALLAFVDRTGIPVATTSGGKSALAESHDLALGVCGTFGTPLANAVVGDADVVLVVGSKLGPGDTASANPALLDPVRQTIIQVDIEPRNVAWTMPCALALTGDARRTLAELGRRLGEGDDTTGERLRAARERVAKLRAEIGYFDDAELQSDATPILPQRVIAELSRAVAADTVVTCDAGENRIFMTHYFQTRGPATFVQSPGVGAMGYALPAALAAKIVHPSRAAVAVSGDGGFAIGMNSIMTSLEESLPVTAVVLNNQALGWVYHGQRNTIASEFGAFDHAAIARSMGARGVRVEEPDELAPTLREAIASGETTVVDVRTSLDETFRKVTSPLATG